VKVKTRFSPKLLRGIFPLFYFPFRHPPLLSLAWAPAQKPCSGCLSFSLTQEGPPLSSPCVPPFGRVLRDGQFYHGVPGENNTLLSLNAPLLSLVFRSIRRSHRTHFVVFFYPLFLNLTSFFSFFSSSTPVGTTRLFSSVTL